MRTCGVEITGSDVLLCILSKDNDVFDIRDVRQTRFTLGNGNDTEIMRKFQFDFAKLMQDYQIDSVAIRERQPKGKFAGSAKGFKMETAIQLIEELDVRVFSTTEIKDLNVTLYLLRLKTQALKSTKKTLLLMPMYTL